MIREFKIDKHKHNKTPLYYRLRQGIADTKFHTEYRAVENIFDLRHLQSNSKHSCNDISDKKQCHVITSQAER